MRPCGVLSTFQWCREQNLKWRTLGAFLSSVFWLTLALQVCFTHEITNGTVLQSQGSFELGRCIIVWFISLQFSITCWFPLFWSCCSLLRMGRATRCSSVRRNSAVWNRAGEGSGAVCDGPTAWEAAGHMHDLGDLEDAWAALWVLHWSQKKFGSINKEWQKYRNQLEELMHLNFGEGYFICFVSKWSTKTTWPEWISGKILPEALGYIERSSKCRH